MKNVALKHHIYSFNSENLDFRMKQRNFRDVEYLKKSQKDISEKINGALDNISKQRSTERPISAPSKGSFIMKAAAQAGFQVTEMWIALSTNQIEAL